MKRTTRYCILCGREIGDEQFCTNPDCGRIPNFYRDVPGPDRKGSRPSGRRGERTEVARAVSKSAQTGSVLSSLGGDRVTMPLTAAPVVRLCSVTGPPEEHAIRPGRTDVGAQPPAGIIIDRPEISSRHARLLCSQDSSGQWKLAIGDLDSTNGTFVNGERIRKSELRAGDRIRFATIEYEVRLPAAKEPRVTLQL